MSIIALSTLIALFFKAGSRSQRVIAAKEAIAMAELPRDALEQIDHIAIAHEIEDAMPRMYGLMKKHHIAAIVPFYPRTSTAANWMLLGDPFSEEVYTPLDFYMVEQIFDRIISDRFLDKLLLHSQLAEAPESAKSPSTFGSRVGRQNTNAERSRGGRSRKS